MPYIANPLEGIPLVNTFITDQSLLGTTPATDDKLIIYDESATALKQLTIAELQASVLVAPAFTGVPTAPTAGAGTDTTQLATTAFVTAATTALNTVTEMTDVTISSIGSGEILKWNGSAWINQTLAEANILPAAGPTFTGVLTVGSAVISEADLEQIDDLTAGTAVASKALVVDGNKDIGTLRNLTIDGTFSDGNYTFDTSGNVSGLGTISGTSLATSAAIPLLLTNGQLVNISLTSQTTGATTLTIPDFASVADTFVFATLAQTLVGKTLTAPTINGVVGGTATSQTITTVTSTTTNAGTLVAAAGSITDSSGAITFGNENLSTTGTLAAGTTTIGSLTVAAASITDSSGALSFGNENLTTTGVITGLTVEATGDTAADDNAAMGYTSAEGLILTGQGSTNDVTIKNDADATVMSIPTGTTGVTFAGTVGSGAITSTGIVTGTGFTAGSAVLAEAELELLDELTAGTAIASKVVTTDASIDTTGQRNLTITGELDAATLDISGIADIAGAVDLHATLDMNTNDIDNIRSATFITEVANGNTSTAMTIDWGAGQKQSVVLNGNCAFTFTNPDGPCNLMLKVTHAANTTTYTPTWAGGSTNVDWPAATAPTFTQTSGSVDMVTFYFDGAIYYGQASLAFS